MRRILAGLLLLVLALLPLAACQAGPVERFPSVTTQLPVPTQAQGTPAAAHPASAPITLRVAAPITAEAAEALRQLYIGFQSGQLARDSQSPIGDRYAPGGALASDRTLSIQFETVPINAVQDGQAWRTLNAGGSLPDVFVSGDLGSLAREQALLDLSSVVDRLDIAGAARMPLFALESMKRDGRLLGIPFLASVPLLYWNPALMQRLGLAMPASLDADGLLALLKQTAARLAAEAAQPGSSRTGAIADIRPLLSIWPAALDTSLTCAGWQGNAFRFESPAVRSVLQVLRSLDVPQLTPNDSLAAAGAWSAESARQTFLAGQSVFLIDDSASLPVLLLQGRVPAMCQPLPVSGFKASLASLAAPRPSPTAAARTTGAPAPTGAPTSTGVPAPTGTLAPTGTSAPAAAAVQPTGSSAPQAGASGTAASPVAESGRQPFRVTAWCVSAQTAYPAEAARFALFLAQDPDAQLILSRFSPLEGWLPLTQSASVWERSLARQSQGKLLKPLSASFNRGSACPSILVPAFRQTMGATLLNPDLYRTDRPVSEADLQSLSRTADDRLARGTS